MMRELGALLFLLWNSVNDIRKKEIVPISILVFAGFPFIYFVLQILKAESESTVRIEYLLVGMIPGILMCGVSKISRGAIGFGDGIVVMVTGLYVGLKMTLSIIMWAFFLSCLWSVLCVSFKKYKFKSQFPFIPFLLLGLVLSLFI